MRRKAGAMPGKPCVCGLTNGVALRVCANADKMLSFHDN